MFIHCKAVRSLVTNRIFGDDTFHITYRRYPDSETRPMLLPSIANLELALDI